MSRRLVVFLGGAIMLAMAVLVARMFREPMSPSPVGEVAQVGDSVSGSLQAASQASLPSPLPSPEAMRMTSGDSAALPVTQVESRPALPAGVAPVVEDSPSGSARVTEAPAASGAPADAAKPPVAAQGAASSASREAEAESVGKSAAGQGASSASPAPAAQPAPKAVAPSAPAAPAPDASAPLTAAAPAPASSTTSSASSTPAKADKALKPGVLVTKSSLPARTGARVVTTAVLTMDGDVVTLNLQGSDAMQGKAFMLTEPDRVVLDIEGDWRVEAPRVPSNRMVKALRTGRQGAATRLVFDMKVKPVKVNVAKTEANSLELTIR